jgi:hypothetical protein
MTQTALLTQDLDFGFSVIIRVHLVLSVVKEFVLIRVSFHGQNACGLIGKAGVLHTSTFVPFATFCVRPQEQALTNFANLRTLHY